MAESKNQPRIKYVRQYDYALLLLTIGLALFGVIMIYSAGYYTASLDNNPYKYVKSQLYSLVIGVVIMLVVSNFDYQVLKQKRFLRKYSLIHAVYILALIMQTAVLFVGQEINGSKRWLKLGPLQFQPSEISKIATIVLIAYAVYNKRKDFDKLAGFVRIFCYIFPLFALIGIENLSSALIIFAIAFGMCFVASKKKMYFVIFGLAAIVGVGLFILLGQGYRMGRIEIWLDVENEPLAFQIRQGLYAIASGGFFGKGLGESMQKLGFIPEAYNDMIFSVICEELGIVGASVLLIAFLALFWRIVIIACHAPDLFGTMLAAGVMIQLAVQVILNVAVVTNSIPSTGVPMPLISYGGTSAIIIMAEIGIVLGISRQVKQK